MCLLKQTVTLLPWCSSVCLSVCPTTKGMHCDNTVQVSMDLTLWLDWIVQCSGHPDTKAGPSTPSRLSPVQNMEKMFYVTPKCGSWLGSSVDSSRGQNTITANYLYVLLSRYLAMQFAIFLFTWLQDLILTFTKILQLLEDSIPQTTCRASPLDPLGTSAPSLGSNSTL